MKTPSQAKVFKDKQCNLCNEVFTPTGQNTKYCINCRETYWKSKSAAYQQAYRIRTGKIKNPGIGSGNGAGRGKQHHSYKTGIGCDFQDQRKKIKEEVRYCEKCGKDLLEATRYYWVVHHKDHDRSHNDRSNLQLLCKRCHQVEHDCHLAFSGRNDYP